MSHYASSLFKRPLQRCNVLKRAKRVQFLSEKHHVLHHVVEPLYRRNAVLIGLWTLAYKLSITFRKQAFSQECLSLEGPLNDNLLANQRRTSSGCRILESLLWSTDNPETILQHVLSLCVAEKHLGWYASEWFLVFCQHVSDPSDFLGIV